MKANPAKLVMRDLAATKVGDFFSALMGRVTKLVEPAITKQAEQIKQLRERIVALESKSINFRGTWQSDENYVRGDATMRHGSLYICGVAGVRGFDPAKAEGDGWRMAVQRGRDGRDRR